MEDYKQNVISFQSSIKSPENSTETDLSISIKLGMQEKLQAIAEAEGTNPVCLAALAIVHLINSKWDWEKGKPRAEVLNVKTV